MPKKVDRLFHSFQPENYNLELIPDRATMTFSGVVTIRGHKVGRPSQRLTFHQKGLKIISAKVIKHDRSGSQDINIIRLNSHAKLDQLRLHCQSKLFPGIYSVTIAFEAPITKSMHGIYPSYYQQDGHQKIIIATQFESHHAREAFPCIDEPEAKATFDLTLKTPVGETVIANTPVINQKSHNQHLITRFETTPRMSTYLLAFAFGDLVYNQAVTNDGVKVRAYSTPHNLELTSYGLDVAVKCLDFFTDYFSTAYPLKKLDMLALPDFSSGAMENWGLITYRETAMLADQQSSSIESRQLVALVIAHELSHQWFGNLVTMKWWNDLWLNESFANLMEYRAIDALYPEWHIWEQFVAHETASAKRRDSLTEVQPVRTAINHPDEISTLFDPSIVYAKGGSVLYMLLNHIGESAFRQGLKSYFNKYAYANTEASDLWFELTTTSHLDVSVFMDGWLNRSGYPLIAVDWQPGSNSLKIIQKRFLSDSEATVTDDIPWQVPLAATVELSDNLLVAKFSTLKIIASNSQPFLLNHLGTSYCLPYYVNRQHLNLIIQAVQAGQVDPVDQLLLIDNYNLLQRSGNVSTIELLNLLPAYYQSDNEGVWGSICSAIGEVRRLIEDDNCEIKFNSLISTMVMPLIKNVGWRDAATDSAQRLRLRGMILSLAAAAQVPSIITSGLKMFKSAAIPNDIPASVRSVVYYIVARHGTQADFTKLLAMHKNVTNADEQDEIACGLTAVKQSRQISILLNMLKGDQVRRQDMMHWWVWLLRNRYSRSAAWHWLITNWDWVQQEFSGDKSYGFFARYAGGIFSRDNELKQFKKFFEPKKSVIALSRDILLGEQEITSRIAWRNRNQRTVTDWLNKT